MGVDAVWLPTDIDEREVEDFLTSDNYCAQTKEDGIHVLASHNVEGRADTRNRRGEPRMDVELAKMIQAWPRETMVDGEKLHEGGFVGFDMLYDAGEDLRAKLYRERLLRLLELAVDSPKNLFRVVETAIGTEAKRALVNRLRKENKEGVIFKDLRSTYTPGRTAWGWSMRRLKFRKSLTAVVLRRPNDTKASFEMFVFDGDKPVNIGSVSAHRFYEQIKPGESMIAECSYLYATPGRKLVQPTLVRFRDDKIASDCLANQLIVGGRFAGR